MWLGDNYDIANLPLKCQIKKDIITIDLHHVSQAKAMKKLKKAEANAEKAKVAPASSGTPSSMVGEPIEKDKTRRFKSHDLDGLPWDALPFVDGGYKGAHSYTVSVEGAVPWMKSMPYIKGSYYLKCGVPSSLTLAYHATIDTSIKKST